MRGQVYGGSELSKKPLDEKAEGQLWEFVQDYAAHGPKLKERVVVVEKNGKRRRVVAPDPTASDLAYWEDREIMERIAAIRDPAKRHAQLLEHARRVAIVRIMEEIARHDDQTLLDLLRFDIRYLYEEEFVGRIYTAKVHSFAAHSEDIFDRSRKFLKGVANIIRKTPKKTPKTPFADYRSKFRWIVLAAQMVFKKYLQPEIEGTRSYEKKVSKLKAVFLDARAKTENGFEKLTNPASLLNLCKGLSITEIIDHLLAEDFNSLAVRALTMKYGITEGNLENQLTKYDLAHPYRAAFAWRNWKIVDQWFKTNAFGITADDLADQIMRIKQLDQVIYKP